MTATTDQIIITADHLKQLSEYELTAATLSKMQALTAQLGDLLAARAAA